MLATAVLVIVMYRQGRHPLGVSNGVGDTVAVPAKGEGFLAGGGVPNLHGLVPASRDDSLAIGAEGHADNPGAEGHAGNPGAVPAQGEGYPAGGGVPNLHGIVQTSGDDSLAIGA